MNLLENLVSLDIWLMGKLGGKPGETMSSAAWNAHITNSWFGWTYLFIDLLFYALQRDHCAKDWAFRERIYK